MRILIPLALILALSINVEGRLLRRGDGGGKATGRRQHKAGHFHRDGPDGEGPRGPRNSQRDGEGFRDGRRGGDDEDSISEIEREIDLEVRDIDEVIEELIAKEVELEVERNEVERGRHGGQGQGGRGHGGRGQRGG